MSEPAIATLLAEIKALRADVQASKTPAVWSVTEIATWLDCSTSTVRHNIVALHGFPSPLAVPGRRRWLANDVIEFLRTRSGRVTKEA